MSNTIGHWDRGNKPVAGTPSVGYPFIIMEWNQPVDDSNNDEILSPLMNFSLEGYKGSKAVTFLINTEAASIANNMVVNIYGSTSNDSTISKWEVMDTVTISNANLTGTTYAHVYDIDAKGTAPYMKIGLTPSADPGAVDIRIGVISGAG